MEHFNFVPLCGETDHIEAGERFPSHRIDIAEGIRRRHLSESVRIIHDRREKIHRLDQGKIGRNPVNSGIFPMLEPPNQIGIFSNREPLKRLVQNPWSHLRCSP